MSGYLVGGNALLRIRSNEFNVLDYSVDRFTRLYSVFVVALFLGLFLDATGGVLFQNSGLYDGTMAVNIGVIGGNFNERLTKVTLIGNLFMLQKIVVPTFGSNGPLWSLANEFWYYLIGPLMFYGLAAVRSLFGIAMLSTALCFLFLFPSSVSVLFSLWLFGALYALVPPVGKKWFFSFSLIIFPAAVVATKTIHLSIPYLLDIVLGLSFLFLMHFIRILSSFSFGKNQNRYLADFSYSLYLLHFPFVIFLVGLTHFITGTGISLEPGFTSFSLFAVFMFTAFLYASSIAHLTERKTYHLRRFLKSRLYMYFRKNEC